MIHVKNNELVCVIIPTYNNGEFLPIAIDSVISQTHSNIEIIVVNDGSTDNTDEVVKGYLDDIIYIKLKNSGPAAARNTGMRSAHGKYIAFLDADDIWLPGKIEEQVNVFHSNPDVTLVYTRMTEFDHTSGEILREFPKKTYSGRIFDNLLTENFILLSSVLIKTSILKEMGGFDENLHTAEDTNLYLKIAKEFDIIGMNSILVKRRKHNTNISDRVDIPIGTLDNLDRIVRIFPETDPMKYPPMKKAYVIKGEALIIQYFYRAEYAKCHDICNKMKTITLTEPAIYFYWLITLLPFSMLNLLRKIKRQLEK